LNSGGVEFDVLNVTGNFVAPVEGLTVELNLLDGFTPAPGDSFGLINVAGDDTILQSLVASDLVDVSVVGGAPGA
jgi:hypothetical protein